MEYFLLAPDTNNKHLPIVSMPPRGLSHKDLRYPKAADIPLHLLVPCTISDTAYIGDYIYQYGIYASNCVVKVLKAYEPRVLSRFTMLVDEKNLRNYQVNLLLLPECEALSERSHFSPDRSTVVHMVLRRSAIEDRSVFCVWFSDRLYPIVRLDVAESLLRRGLSLSLEPLEICDE